MRFDKSRFLKAADLSGEKKFRIKSVSVEEIGTDKKERKPVIWFTNDERGLALNLTNLRTLSGAFGDNMEAWAGKIIVMFPTMVDMRGKMVPALRVRIPPPKQASGNGQTVSAPKPRRQRRRRATSSMRWSGRRRSRLLSRASPTRWMMRFRFDGAQWIGGGLQYVRAVPLPST